MSELFFLIIIVLLTIAVLYFIKQNKILKKKSQESVRPDISSDIARFRNIGELSVFKINSKEIVTCQDEAMKGMWAKMFGWAVTKKQISIIFDFEVNFVYDLKSKDFSIKQLEDGSYKVNMPECAYKYSIKDMKIYDEKNAKFMPYLIPDSLNEVLGLKFSTNDKNKLIEDAKKEAKRVSLKFDEELQNKIHRSACDTIEAIARSFGANSVSFIFNDKKIITEQANTIKIESKNEKN